MAIQLNPYLNFKDNAREAMEFYKSVFDGKLTLQTFKDFNAPTDPGEEDLVMHSELRNDHLMFMASDTPARMGEYQPPAAFGMSLSGDDETTLRGYFDKLCEGGTVLQPMEKAQWGDIFGMVTDKYGVTWLLDVSPAG